MSGLTLHPGHQELHGVTVVVRTTGSRSYIGRFDTQDERGIHLLRVAVHDEAGPASEPGFGAFVAHALAYGVKADRNHLVIAREEVRSVERLGDYAGEA